MFLMDPSSGTFSGEESRWWRLELLLQHITLGCTGFNGKLHFKL